MTTPQTCERCGKTFPYVLYVCRYCKRRVCGTCQFSGPTHIVVDGEAFDIMYSGSCLDCYYDWRAGKRLLARAT